MDISYTLIRSRRRSLGLQIKDGALIVRAPLRATQGQIDALLAKHSRWIETHLAAAAAQGEVEPFTEAELRALAERAKAVIPARVAYWAPKVGVDYGRITIRAQHTRWGSCSGKGNLNFNCLLLLFPDKVIDSVVVHELCHRKEMNHSPRFYAEVRRVMPDYDTYDRYLKAHGKEAMHRLPG